MRIKFLSYLYLFFLLAISLRLAYWQTARAEDLAAMAEGQHLSSQTIEAQRGRILASDRTPLAANQPTFLLYGLPKIIADKGTVADKLAKVLLPFRKSQIEASGSGVADLYRFQIQLKEEYLTKLNQDLFWVPMQKDVDAKSKTEIDKLKLEGIGFEQQSTRFYPEASTAAHLLGFVGSNSYGQQVGYFGLEGFYNGELKGTPGVVKQERDAGGAPIVIGKFFQRQPNIGHDLILNVDPTIQFIADKYIKNGVAKYGAKSGYVVIMEPRSGAVLALAAYPNYDPSRFSDFSKDYYKNPVVADSYEPGSTFKVLQMAAAMNEKLIKPDTICDDCTGPVSVGGYNIRTWNSKYYPNLTMTDTIIHSDNTGMVFVGRKLGIDKMYDYLQKFGFGQLTKIDLQDETSPDIRAKSSWREIDLATASFGQGIAVTGIQMVTAVSAIANGGWLMAPQVVHYIETDQKSIEIKPRQVVKVISEEAAKMVTLMMVDAVNKGEAQFYKKAAGLSDFTIAGKTGTAQIPVEGHYDSTKTIASFIGFAPAHQPRFVMLVRYIEPTSSIYGAETAAPTFFEIARELFTYYGISPSP